MKDCGYKHEMMGMGETDEETRYPQFRLIGAAASGFPKEGEHDIKVRVRVVGTSNPSNGSPAVDLEVLKIGGTPTAKAEVDDDDDDESPLVASMKKMRKEMD